MKNHWLYFFFFLQCVFVPKTLYAQEKDSIDSTKKNPDTCEIQAFTLTYEAAALQLQITQSDLDDLSNAGAWIRINDEKKWVLINQNRIIWPYDATRDGSLISIKTYTQKCDDGHCVEQSNSFLHHIKLASGGAVTVQNIPLWLSILPPLIAILLALVFRQVLLALFFGIFTGAWISQGMPLTITGILGSFLSVLDHYIIDALSSTSHLSVIVFSIMIGGVVAIISRNGGMAGIVRKFEPLAKGPKSTQLVTWILGVAIFFDDYANSLIVGNTVRPLTDKYRISREKLAYIVDSTAAPIAAIAFITTWIGAELNYISDAIPTLTGLENPPSAYSIFLSSLRYSFYSFFTLIFILIIVISGRDFGAMYKAEKRSKETGKLYIRESESITDDDMEELEPVKGAPLRWFNGFIPVAVVVFGTMLGLISTGMEGSFSALVEMGVFQEADFAWSAIWHELHQLDAERQIGGLRKLGILIGNSDSYVALLWASMSAIVVALILTVSQRIMNIGESIETVVAGFKTMMPALLILILAWSLASTTEDLMTAEFLTSALGDSLSPYMVPVVVFILAALIAFSTGSSWSTMAILYPIAIPMVWIISQQAGLDQASAMELLYNVIAVVLAASVLGDHCSPISDTTILSSLACNCNHIDHVKTQLPYALSVGAVSLLMTYVSTAFSLPFLVSFTLGIGLMFLIVYGLGKKIHE